MTTIQKIAIVYAIIANIVGLSVMGIDKRRAICHKWRIPEKTLFLVSIENSLTEGADVWV